MDKKLKQRLISTRKIVKRKLQALKEGTLGKEIELEKSYEPLTKSLRELSTKLYDVGSVKQEIFEPKYKKEDEKEEEEEENTNPPLNFQKTNVVAENEVEDEQEVEDINYIEPDAISEEAFNEYLNQYAPLPRQYIEGMLSSTDEYDNKTGVRHDEKTEKFHIGNSELDFSGENVLINGITYIGTPGLYELLFKKEPLGYNKNDLKDYQDILKRTNAHKRYYKPSEQVAGTRSQKYKQIIQPLFQQPLSWRSTPSPPSTRAVATKLVRKTPLTRKVLNTKGDGLLMNVSENPIDYVHWDNPNELVERLRLLLSSQMAGNNSHNNEIISIIEELKEANLIE